MILSSSDAEENDTDHVEKSPEKIHKVLATRPKTSGALKPCQHASQASAKSTPASSPKKTSKTTKSTKVGPREQKSGSLYSFFNAKTEAQKNPRPVESSQTKAHIRKATVDLDDIIEDEISADEKSISSQSRHPVSCTAPLRRQSSQSCQTTGFTTGQTVHAVSNSFLNQSQRFSRPSLRSDDANNKAANKLGDKRPWAERYGPSNLEELAVHKKKVADVRGWLQSAFEGRHRHVSMVLPNCYTTMVAYLYARDFWF